MYNCTYISFSIICSGSLAVSNYVAFYLNGLCFPATPTPTPETWSQPEDIPPWTCPLLKFPPSQGREKRREERQGGVKRGGEGLRWALRVACQSHIRRQRSAEALTATSEPPLWTRYSFIHFSLSLTAHGEVLHSVLYICVTAVAVNVLVAVLTSPPPWEKSQICFGCLLSSVPWTLLDAPTLERCDLWSVGQRAYELCVCRLFVSSFHHVIARGAFSFPYSSLETLVCLSRNRFFWNRKTSEREIPCSYRNMLKPCKVTA